MAFDKKEKKYLIGMLYLFIFIAVPLAGSTLIDCEGKSFHCVNSTHFMICVDLGGGVSSTLESFLIPCPPSTECQKTNQFECELPKSVAPTIGVDASAPNDIELIETTTDTDTGPAKLLVTADIANVPSITIKTPSEISAADFLSTSKPWRDNVNYTTELSSKSDVQVSNMDIDVSTIKDTVTEKIYVLEVFSEDKQNINITEANINQLGQIFTNINSSAGTSFFNSTEITDSSQTSNITDNLNKQEKKSDVVVLPLADNFFTDPINVHNETATVISVHKNQVEIITPVTEIYSNSLSTLNNVNVHTVKDVTPSDMQYSDSIISSNLSTLDITTDVINLISDNKSTNIEPSAGKALSNETEAVIPSSINSATNDTSGTKQDENSIADEIVKPFPDILVDELFVTHDVTSKIISTQLNQIEITTPVAEIYSNFSNSLINETPITTPTENNISNQTNSGLNIDISSINQDGKNIINDTVTSLRDTLDTVPINVQNETSTITITIYKDTNDMYNDTQLNQVEVITSVAEIYNGLKNTSMNENPNTATTENNISNQTNSGVINDMSGINQDGNNIANDTVTSLIDNLDTVPINVQNETSTIINTLLNQVEVITPIAEVYNGFSNTSMNENPNTAITENNISNQTNNGVTNDTNNTVTSLVDNFDTVPLNVQNETSTIISTQLNLNEVEIITTIAGMQRNFSNTLMDNNANTAKDVKPNDIEYTDSTTDVNDIILNTSSTTRFEPSAKIILSTATETIFSNQTNSSVINDMSDINQDRKNITNNPDLSSADNLFAVPINVQNITSTTIGTQTNQIELIIPDAEIYSNLSNISMNDNTNTSKNKNSSDYTDLITDVNSLISNISSIKSIEPGAVITIPTATESIISSQANSVTNDTSSIKQYEKNVTDEIVATLPDIFVDEPRVKIVGIQLNEEEIITPVAEIYSLFSNTSMNVNASIAKDVKPSDIKYTDSIIYVNNSISNISSITIIEPSVATTIPTEHIIPNESNSRVINDLTGINQDRKSIANDTIKSLEDNFLPVFINVQNETSTINSTQLNREENLSPVAEINGNFSNTMINDNANTVKNLKPSEIKYTDLNTNLNDQKSDIFSTTRIEPSGGITLSTATEAIIRSQINSVTYDLSDIEQERKNITNDTITSLTDNLFAVPIYVQNETTTIIGTQVYKVEITTPVAEMNNDLTNTSMKDNANTSEHVISSYIKNTDSIIPVNNIISNISSTPRIELSAVIPLSTTTESIISTETNTVIKVVTDGKQDEKHYTNEIAAPLPDIFVNEPLVTHNVTSTITGTQLHEEEIIIPVADIYSKFSNTSMNVNANTPKDIKLNYIKYTDSITGVNDIISNINSSVTNKISDFGQGRKNITNNITQNETTTNIGLQLNQAEIKTPVADINVNISKHVKPSDIKYIDSITDVNNIKSNISSITSIGPSAGISLSTASESVIPSQTNKVTNSISGIKQVLQNITGEIVTIDNNIFTVLNNVQNDTSTVIGSEQNQVDGIVSTTEIYSSFLSTSANVNANNLNELTSIDIKYSDSISSTNSPIPETNVNNVITYNSFNIDIESEAEIILTNATEMTIASQTDSITNDDIKSITQENKNKTDKTITPLADISVGEVIGNQNIESTVISAQQDQVVILTPVREIYDNLLGTTTNVNANTKDIISKNKVNKEISSNANTENIKYNNSNIDSIFKNYRRINNETKMHNILNETSDTMLQIAPVDLNADQIRNTTKRLDPNTTISINSNILVNVLNTESLDHVTETVIDNNSFNKLNILNNTSETHAGNILKETSVASGSSPNMTQERFRNGSNESTISTINNVDINVALTTSKIAYLTEIPITEAYDTTLKTPMELSMPVNILQDNTTDNSDGNIGFTETLPITVIGKTLVMTNTPTYSITSNHNNQPTIKIKEGAVPIAVTTTSTDKLRIDGEIDAVTLENKTSVNTEQMYRLDETDAGSDIKAASTSEYDGVKVKIKKYNNTSLLKELNVTTGIDSKFTMADIKQTAPEVLNILYGTQNLDKKQKLSTVNVGMTTLASSLTQHELNNLHISNNNLVSDMMVFLNKNVSLMKDNLTFDSSNSEKITSASNIDPSTYLIEHVIQNITDVVKGAPSTNEVHHNIHSEILENSNQLLSKKIVTSNNTDIINLSVDDLPNINQHISNKTINNIKITPDNFMLRFYKNIPQDKKEAAVQNAPETVVNLNDVIIPAFELNGGIISQPQTSLDNETKYNLNAIYDNITISDIGNKAENSTLEFNCHKRKRGRYSDKQDCSKYYICIGRSSPIIGKCPANTVFSEIIKQCTKNTTHCNKDKEFKCSTPGRFTDISIDNIYYICVRSGERFIRFKFQCQTGFDLDQGSVKCIKKLDLETHNNSSVSIDNSKSEMSVNDNTENIGDKHKSNDAKSKTKFKCVEEGIFDDINDCRKYYVCTKNKKSEFRKRKKKCDKDEVFHKNKKKCVDDDSYEC